MAELKVYYWTGFISPDTINQPGWIDVWKFKAENIEAANEEMIVFKVPKEHRMQMTTDIEQMLQEKYGIPNR